MKNENNSIINFNELVKDKISTFKFDLKKNENEIINFKKEIEDLRESIEDGNIEKNQISIKIIKLVENLNSINNNNIEVIILKAKLKLNI